MDPERDDLTELALAGGDGDVVAVAAFARATYRDVWRFCANLDQESAADDLTQEVYVRALRALPAFQGQRLGQDMAPGHRPANRGRRRAVTRSSASPRSSRSVWGGASPDPTGLVDVRQVLDQLDNDRRIAFVLTQVVGLSYAAAAEVCNCPIGTVRSRVARARETLVQALEGVPG